MLALLLLLGASITVGAVLSGGSDSGSGEPEEQVFDDEDQNILSEDLNDTVVTNLDNFVEEGFLSEEEAETFLEETIFIEGPLNVDAGGGDDSVLGSESDDRIVAGAGDDVVFGGAGDDEVFLGDGDDDYGIDTSVPEANAQGGPVFDLGDDFIESGDDIVRGGAGSDVIVDGYGANQLFGGVDGDFLSAVDQEDDLTPDTVDGGFGADEIVVDEGDTVTTGDQADKVFVDLHTGAEEGYEVVTITDFDPERDELQLFGDVELSGNSDSPEESQVTVAETEDGTGSVISVGGVPVVILEGVEVSVASDVFEFA